MKDIVILITWLAFLACMAVIVLANIYKINCSKDRKDLMLEVWKYLHDDDMIKTLPSKFRIDLMNGFCKRFGSMKFDIWTTVCYGPGMDAPYEARLLHSQIEGKDFNDACRNWISQYPEEATRFGGVEFVNDVPYCWVISSSPVRLLPYKS